MERLCGRRQEQRPSSQRLHREAVMAPSAPPRPAPGHVACRKNATSFCGPSRLPGTTRTLRADAMKELVEGQELSGGVLPQLETSLQSFMASVARSAMETWLRSPTVLGERVALFENMRILAGMRFDPPLFDGACADDEGDEEEEEMDEDEDGEANTS
ncbi:hypothetical protein CERZMDRAFT_84217 [Cercospora zeae-maydis SCOH1-5]|uniref:Uncharacterized protein n=1 Tax=Cercospora zeae-maydis SCOH1-5 TaxID=717836 RepID=A0A6A6FGE8_9PEZI|nr:hypothetical protein CERZMDRAFT_84217 [Cercospora zeae-maydis SCOH1-5]